MNSVFFLIPLLLVVSLPSVYGQIITTQGQNYDLTEDFTIGEAIWQSHPERIFALGEWQNYVLEDTDDKVIFNSNAVGSLIYHKNYCSYTIHENGFNGDVIIPTVSSVAIYLKDGTWQHLPVNDQACTVSTVSYDNGVILTATKTITTTGIVVEEFTQEIRMDIRNGFKETFKVTHDGTEKLGITQTIHTGAEIVIGDTTINIAEYNGQSFNREFIVDNQAEILKLTDSINYDFDEGINSLTNVNIIYENNKYKVNLDYSSGDFVGYLEIDPTFTSVTANYQASLYDSNNNNVFEDNPSTVGVSVVTSYQIDIGRVSTSEGNDGKRGVVEWDISSIPNTSIITDTIITFDMVIYGSADNCEFRELTIQPSTSSSSTGLWQDIKANTIYVDNSSLCASASTGNVLDLGTDADADVTSNLSSGWFALGMMSENENIDSSYHLSRMEMNPTLTVVYTILTAPDPPTNLSTAQTVANQINLTFSAPVDDGGSAITNYKIYLAGTLIDTIGNITTYTDTISGSEIGSSLVYTVKATNGIGDSSASSSSTITAWDVPDQVTGLTGVVGIPIVLSWNAPSSDDTITSYKIYRGGSLLTTLGNVLTYSDSAISGGTTYSYTVSSVSAVGEGTQSSPVSVLAGVPYNAPTNVSVTIPSPNSAPLSPVITWTASTAGSATGTLTGYEIFRDTVSIGTVGLVTTYTDTVSQSGTFAYILQSTSNHGSSGNSLSVSITTPTVPPAPLNPTSTIPDPDNSPYDVILTYQVPATNGGSAITGYSISRDGNTIGTTNAGTFTFNDTTPSNACTNFDYKIYTINNVGTGTAYANTVITTPCVPDTPVLSIIQTSTTLSWTTPNTGGSIITGYEIHRGNSLLTTVGLVNDYVDHSQITFGNLYTFGIKAINTVGTSNFSNVVQTTPSVDVTTLTPTGITGTGVILFWNEPPYFQGVITDYTILYDTPHNTAPLNVLIANTGTTLSQYTVGNLQYLTDYSFVVMANSVLGSSSNGNVIDITTLLDTSTVSYDTVGSFDIDAVNPNLLNQIKFTRTDSTATNTEGETIDVATVDVEFPLNYNLTCTFNYKFAVTNDTYTNLGYQQGNVTQLNADALQTTFILNDVGNEIVHIICTDVISEDSAEMLVMQNNFPLLQQISAFQSGDFGTEGKFGILDIVVLFTILISMMAFNRVNQIVGIVVSLSFVFAMAWFSIIEIPTAFLGIIAVILMFAIGSHRKQ